MLLPCKPFLQELACPSWLLQPRLCSFSHSVGFIGWTIARGSASATMLAVSPCGFGMFRDGKGGADGFTSCRHVAGHEASPLPSRAANSAVLFCFSGFSRGLRAEPAFLLLLLCQFAPRLPVLLRLHPRCCQFGCLHALSTCQGVSEQHPVSSLLRGSWQRAVKPPVPLFPALLAPAHPGGMIPVELPVSPGWDSPSRGAAPGRDALCQALSLARLHYGDYRGTAQHPNTLRWCRAEELALSRALWQGPAISISVTETTTISPLLGYF